MALPLFTWQWGLQSTLLFFCCWALTADTQCPQVDCTTAEMKASERGGYSHVEREGEETDSSVLDLHVELLQLGMTRIGGTPTQSPRHIDTNGSIKIHGLNRTIPVSSNVSQQARYVFNSKHQGAQNSFNTEHPIKRQQTHAAIEVAPRITNTLSANKSDALPDFRADVESVIDYYGWDLFESVQIWTAFDHDARGDSSQMLITNENRMARCLLYLCVIALACLALSLTYLQVRCQPSSS